MNSISRDSLKKQNQLFKIWAALSLLSQGLSGHCFPEKGSFHLRCIGCSTCNIFISCDVHGSFAQCSFNSYVFILTGLGKWKQAHQNRDLMDTEKKMIYKNVWYAGSTNRCHAFRTKNMKVVLELVQFWKQMVITTRSIFTRLPYGCQDWSTFVWWTTVIYYHPCSILFMTT